MPLGAVKMKEIIPTVDKWDILCAETRAGPNGVVVFGASGDLAGRKLFVSIFQLHIQGLLDDSFYLLGCGRTKFSDKQFREKVEQSILQNYNCKLLPLQVQSRSL